MSEPAKSASQDAYEMAKDIYCTMRVCRIATISKRVQVPSWQIEEWRDRDGWLSARNQRISEQKQEVISKIGSRFDTAVKVAKTANLARQIIHDELVAMKARSNGNRWAKQIVELTEALKKIDLILERQHNFAQKGQLEKLAATGGAIDLGR